jgi:hypothetical protein
MRLQVIILVAAGILSTSLTAAAQDAAADEARELFKQGVTHFEADRHEQALSAFERAYELRPNWKLLYNIGQCHAVLKAYGLAIESFEAYLAEGGDDILSDRRDEVLEEVRRLRDMVGNLNVTGPDGLSVYVDGALRGKTPLLTPIRVTAGKKHQVSIKSGPEEVLARELVVGSAQTATIKAPSKGAPSPVTPPAGEPAEEPTQEPAPMPEPDDSADGLSPVFFWVGLGATAAFGGGAIAMNFAAQGKIDEIKDDPTDQGLRDSGKAIQAVGIVCLGVAGAAAITTGVLAAFTDFSGDEDPLASAAVTPFTTPNGGGLAVQGSF